MLPAGRRPRPFAPRARLLVAAVGAALGLAACAGAPTQTPAAASPSPGASFSVLPAIVNSELVVGPDRLLFGFVDAKTNTPAAAPDRTASVTVYPQAAGPSTGVTSPGTFMWTIPDSVGIYRAAVTFGQAGTWIAQFTTAAAGQAPETVGPFTFDVRAQATTIQAGQKAPSVKTPTLADVGGDVAKLSSDTDPDPAFYQVSEDAALAAGKPFVLIFATPKFCTSRACGPLLDLVKSLASQYPSVTFINVEPYKLTYADGQLQPVLDAQGQLQPVGASNAFGLVSEPWVFVIDATGTVTASYEATSDKAELTQAISAVSGG